MSSQLRQPTPPLRPLARRGTQAGVRVLLRQPHLAQRKCGRVKLEPIDRFLHRTRAAANDDAPAGGGSGGTHPPENIALPLLLDDDAASAAAARDDDYDRRSQDFDVPTSPKFYYKRHIHDRFQSRRYSRTHAGNPRTPRSSSDE